MVTVPNAPLRRGSIHFAAAVSVEVAKDCSLSSTGTASRSRSSGRAYSLRSYWGHAWGTRHRETAPSADDERGARMPDEHGDGCTSRLLRGASQFRFNVWRQPLWQGRPYSHRYSQGRQPTPTQPDPNGWAEQGPHPPASPP